MVNKLKITSAQKYPENAWRGLKTVTGGLRRKIINPPRDLIKFINDLNVFYCRFDAADFSNVNAQVGEELKLNASDKNSGT